MPECGYCGAEFDDEGAYLDHLRDEHFEELGPIDRRRVDPPSSGGGLPTGPLAIGAVVLFSAALVVYVTFFVGSGGGDGPRNVGSVHYHGMMTVVIDGAQVDFSDDAYQFRQTGVRAFHYEANDGSEWHVHAEGVTLAWALDSLGFEVTATTVAVDGTTYDDADPDTTVSVTVNGESVTPSAYVLREGDDVRIVVEVG